MTESDFRNLFNQYARAAMNAELAATGRDLLPGSPDWHEVEWIEESIRMRECIIHAAIHRPPQFDVRGVDSDEPSEQRCREGWE